MLTDNTALLEAKRSARCREDTYLEHVMDSSGLRIVKHSVFESKLWCHTSTEASKEAIPCGGNAASLAEEVLGQGRATKARHRQASRRTRRQDAPGVKKRRKVDTKNLWMAANVSGRFANKNDHAKYIRDMQDAQLKEHQGAAMLPGATFRASARGPGTSPWSTRCASSGRMHIGPRNLGTRSRPGSSFSEAQRMLSDRKSAWRRGACGQKAPGGHRNSRATKRFLGGSAARAQERRAAEARFSLGS